MSLDYLAVAFCSHEAARFAIEHWHYSRGTYSKRMPSGKLVKVGAWEHDAFVGAVVFSRGSAQAPKGWGVDQVEMCELSRLALRPGHEAPVSTVLARALSLLKTANPGLRFVVSFADPADGHIGTIYKATNWLYTGESQSTTEWKIGGRWHHTRGAWATVRGKTDSVPKRTMRGKHRYVYPLDRPMRRQLARYAQPYPVR